MGKLRAIDKGTRYDISGGLRRLVRRIEQGEFDNLSHVMVGVTCRQLDGAFSTETFNVGTANVAEMGCTVDSMKKRLV